jgi:hypothetical protein
MSTFPCQYHSTSASILIITYMLILTGQKGEDWERSKQGRTQEGGGCRAAAPPKRPQNRNLKKKDLVDIILTKVLRDFPFSRNQPLKSADD